MECFSVTASMNVVTLGPSGAGRSLPATSPEFVVYHNELRDKVVPPKINMEATCVALLSLTPHAAGVVAQLGADVVFVTRRRSD